ncbi:MAG: nucleotide sugar dehydrogenase [Candidatus Bathyarchaeia archaeon]
MRLVVVGMGYVGVPLAACFASVPGIEVTGLQRRSARSGWKIEQINRGLSPIGGREPGLSGLLRQVVADGSLQVTDDPAICSVADVVILTVQTPLAEGNEPIMGPLIDACSDVGSEVQEGALLSLESTVAPGTTENIVAPILERRSGMTPGVDFNIVYSYERVMAGRLLHSLRSYPRIIGGLTSHCADRGEELYKKIAWGLIYKTDCITAELSKVAENTYRDVNIALANEIAMISEALGVNFYELRHYVNSLPNNPDHPSYNPHRNLHLPGAGVGGHCLPKDPWLMLHGCKSYGTKVYDYSMITICRGINNGMPLKMSEKVLAALHERGLDVADSRIALLGFAFRGDIDDPRNTPALEIYNNLLKLSGDVIVHDPYIACYPGVNITQSLSKAIDGCNCLVVVTDHSIYRALPLDWIKGLMSTPIIVDGRNLFNSEKCLRMGFTFRGIGVPEAGA